MNLFEQKQYPRTLYQLPDEVNEVWLFEDSPTRQRYQSQHNRAHADKPIRIRSAYKTLVHEALETKLFINCAKATIYYPVIEGDEPLRFRLECYPLPSLFTHCEFEFVPQSVSALSDNHMPAYRIHRQYRDGDDEMHLPVPVKWVSRPDGTDVLSACGWQRGHEINAPLRTDFEALFDDCCDFFAHVDLSPLDDNEPQGPFFERLNCHVQTPHQDVVLAVGHEVISLTEALHEEIYFAANEIFLSRLGLQPLSRTLKPGQVIPTFSSGETLSLTISHEPSTSDEDAALHSHVNLEQATSWLYPEQIRAVMESIDGKSFSLTSRQGRDVIGKAIISDKATAPKLAISAAQHANETSGIVGALRAATKLVADNDTSFTICPVDNVDGYALYRELCQTTPNHMLHAARYSAAGNDIGYGNGEFETGIRELAKSHLNARVHVNCHGYPAHEWTRPLSGYVPRGFARWTIPKGFFLIGRYHGEQHLPLMKGIINAALDALMAYPDIVRLNRTMLDRYLTAVGSHDFAIHQGTIPYVMDAGTSDPYPVTLITEAPDESIYGEDYRIMHEAQYRVIMAVRDFLKNNSLSQEN